MITSKSILGTISAIGTVGSGALAYKLGAFKSSKESPTTRIVTVKQQLKDKGYELISEVNNLESQWKTSFNAFKSDSVFLAEINKHTENGEVLTSESDENKGEAALKKLCTSYLEGNHRFDNASKWCVLRIMDKAPKEGWLPYGRWKWECCR